LKLTTLATRNFRNLSDRQWEFHPTANVIVGDNGQGKTNLIEAVYVLATTKSFRTARVANVVRLGESNMFVQGSVEHESVSRTLSIGIQGGDERRRELLVNGQKLALGDYLRTVQLLAYSSSQIELLRGGPEWRRRFLDRGVASIRPGHLAELSRYSRVVKQRNALLESVATGRAKAALLEAWDEELIQASQSIIAARREYVEKLEGAYRDVVAAHRYHVTDLVVRYEPSLSGEAAADRALLSANRGRDLRLRHTTAGPHRDEITISSRGRAAAEILSSGEQKMTVLFLSLACLEIFREKFDYAPVFLLDDIDAELDLGILQRLVAYLVQTTQLFTTSAKEPFLDRIDLGEHRRFVLESGTVISWKDGGS
jgi:DNA replication and repair protein RecF